MFTFDKQKILEIGESISKYLILREDYLPNDFTVYIYKQDWGERHGF
jgi:hypothetical protein